MARLVWRLHPQRDSHRRKDRPMFASTSPAGADAMTAPEPQTPSPKRRAAPGLLVEIGVNFVLPLLVYDHYKPLYGDVGALLAASAPPLAWSVVEFVRRRRVDALSLLALAGVGLSLLAFVGGGGVHLLQLRETLVTGLIGLVFLVSAAIGKPLIHQLARAGAARKSPEALAEFDARRDAPRLPALHDDDDARLGDRPDGRGGARGRARLRRSRADLPDPGPCPGLRRDGRPGPVDAVAPPPLAPGEVKARIARARRPAGRLGRASRRLSARWTTGSAAAPPGRRACARRRPR